MEWRVFTQIGHVHLSSGGDAWVHVIAGGNRLSRNIGREAAETLDTLRSYRPRT